MKGMKHALAPPKEALDPQLDSLFNTSATPARSQAVELQSSSTTPAKRRDCRSSGEKLSLPEPDPPGALPSRRSGGSAGDPSTHDPDDTDVPRRRKRKRDDADIEGNYLRKLYLAEAEDDAKRLKKSAVVSSGDSREQDLLESTDDEERPEAASKGGSKKEEHRSSGRETLHVTKDDQLELEKASRTVFLGNVSTDAITSKQAKKTLLSHLSSFFPSISSKAGPDGPAHKIESIRFRSTAFASREIPKRAAFVKKEVLPATTKATNAYVVYSTALAAREAAKRLNGSIVLDRHLRVDSVAHPAKVDHRRCVFVGNLGFVDDESTADTTSDADATGAAKKAKKGKQGADLEEGLWRQFGQAGTVESVRVVRDAGTRVGKGFAYVQFTDANAVEAALLFNDKKFPPLLPRKLRVSRAKKMRKAAAPAAKPAETPAMSQKPGNGAADIGPVYVSKASASMKTLQGRAAKLLGRGAAARLKANGTGANAVAPTRRDDRGGHGAGSVDVAPEGHRATKQDGQTKNRRRASGGRKAKHGHQRSAAWKAAGGASEKKK